MATEEEIENWGIAVSTLELEMAEDYHSRGWHGSDPCGYKYFSGSLLTLVRLEKVQGMANESVRGFRGWIYAIFVAVCLLLIFVVGENLSRVKQPGFYHAPRTATLSISTKPKVFPKIATESIPLVIESMSSTTEWDSWIDYRIASSASIALLEPPAGARLTAPISSSIGSDPFHDSSRSQRSPSVLAESAAGSTHTAATSVSSIRQNNTNEPFDRTWLTSDHIVTVNNNAWPISTRLLNEIKQVQTVSTNKAASEVQNWVGEISSNYEKLTQQLLVDETSAETLESLRALVTQGYKIAKQTLETDAALSSDVARLSYSIERRTAVWTAVSSCVLKGKTHLVAARNHHVDSRQLKECLANAQMAIQKTGDASNWSQYLMLELLKQLAADEITGRQDQVDLVRQFLGRITNNRLSEAQRSVLASTEVHKLADQVHPLSIGPVDYRKLIEDLETLESDPVHRCSKTMADAMQSLRFSEHPEQAAVANAIGVHYRNANLRLAVSEEFINRIMPKQTVIEKPVRQSILGADTRGSSQVITKLKVDFLQDVNSLKVALNLEGEINSKTQSSRQGATFYNSSIANVNAVRELTISTQGMNINGRPATVESTDSLRKFSTDWDRLPILGDLVRQFAHREFVQARPLAKRIMQRTIAQQTDKEFDQQLQAKVHSFEGEFNKRLIGPLQSLDLSPMVMDMQTTDTRLIVRYRLASSDQLSANTSRPIAPGDSHLSLQVHQSAFNNMVSRVVEGERDWTMQELSDKISDLLQQPSKALPDDAPTDVTARFVESRPISVEFEDGQLWLTLRIASLEQPGRFHLKNFIIRTSYQPSVDGLHAELMHEGDIRTDGPKMTTRNRVALRAIFMKIFSSRSSIPMVSEELLRDPRAAGLAVSQLELRDGWLGMAISQDNSPHVARVRASQETIRR